MGVVGCVDWWDGGGRDLVGVLRELDGGEILVCWGFWVRIGGVR